MKKIKKQEIEKYLTLPYSFIITPDEDNGKTYYVCKIAELPGCIAHGKTAIEAQKNIKDAIYDWIETALLDEYEIPEPSINSAKSRKNFTLRMPGKLENEVKIQAELEKKSVNQFILDKLAHA